MSYSDALSTTRDDPRLIEEAKRGDREAFGQLVRKYQNRLYAAIVHRSGCPDEAEDHVQNAFARAFAKVATFRGDSSFYTWLYRIAMNQRISEKRRRTLVFRPWRDGPQCNRTAKDESPESRLQREETVEHVRAALSQLDVQHRTILVLREIDRFNYRAIADILRIRVGTVRSRLHRAREQMRRQLRARYA